MMTISSVSCHDYTDIYISYYISNKSNNPVGLLEAKHIKNNEDIGEHLQICNISVDENYRRKKIATSMYKSLRSEYPNLRTIIQNITDIGRLFWSSFHNPKIQYE